MPSFDLPVFDVTQFADRDLDYNPTAIIDALDDADLPVDLYFALGGIR